MQIIDAAACSLAILAGQAVHCEILTLLGGEVLLWVDVQHAVIVGCMDAVNGAHIDA